MVVDGKTGNKNAVMKFILLILFFLPGAFAIAQKDTVSLKDAMSRLDRALLDKDEKTLEALLHKELSYGHSNAWIQTKKNVIGDLKSGKMIYNKIENSSVMIVAQNKNWATVRTNTNAEGEVDHKPFQLKLHVLQVWIHTKQGWQLFARQSTKL
jgi:hypothetical protein